MTKDTERHRTKALFTWTGFDMIWVRKWTKVDYCISWKELGIMIPLPSLTVTCDKCGLNVLNRINSSLCAEKSQRSKWKLSILFGWFCIPFPLHSYVYDGQTAIFVFTSFAALTINNSYLLRASNEPRTMLHMLHMLRFIYSSNNSVLFILLVAPAFGCGNRFREVMYLPRVT